MKLTALLLLAAVGAAVARTSYEGYKVYRFALSSQEHLNAVTELDGAIGFDFWSRHQTLGVPLTLMVAPPQQQAFLAFLHTQRINYDVIIENAETVFAEERMRQESAEKVSGKISFSVYHRFNEINAYLEDLAARFPEKVTLKNVGTSFEGRPLNLIRVSTNPTANNPVIFIDAGIHAREWIAPAMALYIIQEVVENAANSNLLDGLDWHILPVVNPDGYEFSHDSTRMWRKTRSTTSSTSCPGVDGNRNYGYHWSEGGTSTNPCSDTFHGANAFSEAESRAVRDHLDTIKTRVPLYLTIHSYGEYFVYPWSYAGSPVTANKPDLDALAGRANRAQIAAGGNSYRIGQSTSIFGATAGSSDDWAMGGALVPMSYTIELPGGGLTGFDMPASQIQTTVETFFPAIREFGLHSQGNKK